MIKFSLSHSKILDKAGDALKEAEHAAHLAIVAAELEAHGVEVEAISKYDIVARTTKEKFHHLFDIAEHALDHFYGEVAGVLHNVANHLEHLSTEHHHHHHDRHTRMNLLIVK